MEHAIPPERGVRNEKNPSIPHNTEENTDRVYIQNPKTEACRIGPNLGPPQNPNEQSLVA